MDHMFIPLPYIKHKETYLSQEYKSLNTVNRGSWGGNHGASLSHWLWQDKERKKKKSFNAASGS